MNNSGMVIHLVSRSACFGKSEADRGMKAFVGVTIYKSDVLTKFQMNFSTGLLLKKKKTIFGPI